MPTFLRVAIARILAFLRSTSLDRELDEELEAHLEMAEEDLVRRGLTPEEARRQARLELGGVTQLKEASRETRGLPWVASLWLDVKLGYRMLRKSWGLTLIGGLAIAVVIGIGAVVIGFFDLVLWQRLPLDEGERVVAVQTFLGGDDSPSTIADFERWRDELGTLVDVGAYREVQRVWTGDGTAGEPVAVAEMTASGFTLARVPPLLGRALVEADEHEGAAPVMVIGHDVWRSRFASDSSVIGRTVRLGDTVHTIVGVMPEGFAFPINHRLWTPLRTGSLRGARGATRADAQLGAGAKVFVFARLAPGVTLENAQAELATVGLLPKARSGVGQSPRPAVRINAIEDRREPRVVPYVWARFFDATPAEAMWVVRVSLLLVGLLMVPPCANIAILVYARIVTRQEELAARYVLGASRSRIVVQLFVEMLVLSALAAVVALVATHFARALLEDVFARELGGRPPFWMDFGLSLPATLFAAGLALFAALVAGIAPALKATGRLAQSGLRSLGGRTGMKLGRTWTALVAAQVAFAVAILPTAIEWAWGTLRPAFVGPGFAAEDYLTARVSVDSQAAEGVDAGELFDTTQGERPVVGTRVANLHAQLVRELASTPGVDAVASSASIPGRERWVGVEIDGISPPTSFASALPYFAAYANRVGETFFDTFEVPLLSGRAFGPGDFAPGASAVLINRTFAHDIAGEGSPLGRRLRYVRTQGGPILEEGPWYEIIGVVDDLPANPTSRKLYHALDLANGSGDAATKTTLLTQESQVSLALRITRNRSGVIERLQQISAEEPTLRLDALRPLDEVYRELLIVNNMGTLALALVTLSVLLLSAAGLYALMSFTVNQRRREIGIRSALGAQPQRLLATIYRRALAQVAIGGAIGMLLAIAVGAFFPIEEIGGGHVPGVLPGTALLMVAIGLIAALGPSRRGLRVQPSEALREG